MIRNIIDWMYKRPFKLLHIALCALIYQTLFSLTNDVVASAIGTLFVGLVWEFIGKLLYQKDVSVRDMTYNGIGVLLGILLSLI